MATKARQRALAISLNDVENGLALRKPRTYYLQSKFLELLKNTTKILTNRVCPRNTFPKTTCGRSRFPSGRSKDLRLVAKLHHTNEEQGGPRDNKAPGRSRRTSRRAKAKPSLMWKIHESTDGGSFKCISTQIQIDILLSMQV